jgi:SAM-dependent methyltransferase
MTGADTLRNNHMDTLSNTSQPDYPAARKYLGGIAADYLQRRETHPTWIWEHAQVQQYAQSRASGLTVLDVPFGTGRYAPIYLHAGWRVTGCDISKDMVTEAERTLGADVFARCDVRVAPAEQLPWPDRSFDVIVSSRFIQWLPELQHVDRVIAEFSRVGRSELFLQLRIPAEPRARAEMPRPLDYVAALVRSLRKRLRPTTGPKKARIVSHPEPELLAITERYGWKLQEIGVECPTSRGLRFYRFEK